MTAMTAGRAWRVAATGLAFAVFALGALLLSVSLFPLLALTAPDAAIARRRIQRGVHHACRGFVELAKALGLLTYEVHGLEHLRVPGRLVVANHPSLMDVAFLLGWLPEADCVVKDALTRNPFLKWAVRWAGYVGNAQPEGLVDDCAASLRAGRSLIVFPEGTRSVAGRPFAMRRGAARIALQSGADIVPVQIRCEPPMLTKGSKWYQVPPQRSHYRFLIGAPLSVQSYRRDGEPLPLAARRLSRLLESVLNAEARRQPAAAPAYSFT